MTTPVTARPNPSASDRTPRTEPFSPLPIMTSANPRNSAHVAAATDDAGIHGPPRFGSSASDETTSVTARHATRSECANE